jgi:hypothetical protein
MRFITLVFFSFAFVAGGAEKLSPIFDGRTLDGWEVLNGKAKYEAENGMIVGTAVNGSPNSFLCTKKHYGDFILEFETKVDGDLNSGVQIRSHTYKTEQTVFVWRDGKWWKRVQPPGRVYGYQVEIANKIHASGGVFDEGRRGWLQYVADDPVAGNAFKDEQWNKFRVVAIGDSIKTWVNGVPCTDIVDPIDQSGFLGLQVHEFKSTRTTQVRWRNIRIQDLGAHAWQPLAGKAKLADFTLRVKFKAAAKASGSVVFRSGLRAVIDTEGNTGSLYDAGGRELAKADASAVNQYYKPGDWNELAISAHGARVAVHVNGIKTADVKTDSGKAGELKMSGSEVMFKDLEILRPVKK